jgi:hypothetical protein
MQEAFYLNETVRLVREVSGLAVPPDTEGTVLAIDPSCSSLVSVRFRTADGLVDASVSRELIEPAISRSVLDRTAVFWGLETDPEKLVEAALNSVLDRGFVLRAGLNVARMSYNRPDHWWKWEDRIADPTGARAVAAGHTWDGLVIALSGPERFHLEFRMNGRDDAAILLHELDGAYMRQITNSEAATSMVAILTGLYADIGAEFCAFPVADPWLTDEDWRSLLAPPFYPDVLLLPDPAVPALMPGPFRAARITPMRVMMTALPVRIDPTEGPVERSERDLQLDRLRKCNALGEKYYNQLYETRLHPAALYSGAKEAFIDAIVAANGLGLADEARALEARLENIKGVFRSQFS